jgi:hypothetical protein
MTSMFWVASTKPGKDAGSAHIEIRYGRDRGRRMAPRDSGPEHDMYCWKGHLDPYAREAGAVAIELDAELGAAGLDGESERAGTDRAELDRLEGAPAERR